MKNKKLKFKPEVVEQVDINLFDYMPIGESLRPEGRSFFCFS
jgi:hypothetical protein